MARPRTFEDRAKARLGTTTVWRRAGYLTPDGSLLELGRASHAGIGPALGMESTPAAVYRALEAGFARVAGDAEMLSIQTVRPLTYAQIAAISAVMAEPRAERLFLDVTSASDPGHTVASFEARAGRDGHEVAGVLFAANRAAQPGRARLRRSRRR